MEATETKTIEKTIMEKITKPVKLVIVGAGSRGTNFAKIALEKPELVKIVGVAEPRKFYRDNIVNTYNVPTENVFSDWRLMAGKEKFADAVLIATQDKMHTEPAEALAAKGYHILLEKPMATTPKDCKRIEKAVLDSGIIFCICHVRRYTPFTVKLKEIIDAGLIGDIMSIQLLEPVCYWHQAHSYVRGPWRNSTESAPMLLAKSCHDLDWIRYLIGCRCVKISSFGNLSHFKKENQPENATDYCVNCPHSNKCAYSAVRLYMNKFRAGYRTSFIDKVSNVHTEEALLESLKTSPYGRCVYNCDNDVVDHQVVNMEFEKGQTASFTMTAFTKQQGRQVRVFGTKGDITGNDIQISRYDFLTETTETIEFETIPGIVGGHGGGDSAVINAFVEAVAYNDPSKILSGPTESLETHLMVFAAEQARKLDCVVKL